MPRVVTAAVPNRRPLVYHGPLGSNGIGLRFSVIPHLRTASSAWRPVIPWVEATSRTSKWLSVPPVSTFKPSRTNASARARALSTIWWAYVCELGPKRLGEGDRLGRHHVGQRAPQHQRAASVDVLLELVGAEHQPSPRPAQGLVGRRGHDVGIGDRVEFAL